MPRLNPNRRHARRGQAVLDAALVFPILLSLTFGCIEFGDYYFIKHTLQGAAREGARAAATGTSLTDVTNAVANCMSAAGFTSSQYTTNAYTVTGVNPDGTPILSAAYTSSSITSTTPTTGTAILVKVSVTWGTVGIRPMKLLDANRTVSGAVTMRREG